MAFTLQLKDPGGQPKDIREAEPGQVDFIAGQQNKPMLEHEYETEIYNIFASNKELADVGLSHVACENKRCEIAIYGDPKNAIKTAEHLENSLEKVLSNYPSGINIVQDEYGGVKIMLDVQLSVQN